MVKDAEQEEVISANTSYCALKYLECTEPKRARVDTANTNGGSAAHPVALPPMAPSVQEACLICLGFELSQESGGTREHTRHQHACGACGHVERVSPPSQRRRFRFNASNSSG